MGEEAGEEGGAAVEAGRVIPAEKEFETVNPTFGSEESRLIETKGAVSEIGNEIANETGIETENEIVRGTEIATEIGVTAIPIGAHHAAVHQAGAGHQSPATSVIGISHR